MAYVLKFIQRVHCRLSWRVSEQVDLKIKHCIKPQPWQSLCFLKGQLPILAIATITYQISTTMWLQSTSGKPGCMELHTGLALSSTCSPYKLLSSGNARTRALRMYTALLLSRTFAARVRTRLVSLPACPSLSVFLSKALYQVNVLLLSRFLVHSCTCEHIKRTARYLSSRHCEWHYAGTNLVRDCVTLYIRFCT